MYEYTKRIGLDKSKRHFVVGDIHGRMDAFDNLLESVNYDPENDIIYSVGDIIDRGDKSYEAVCFFSQPNTHCIMGNHEYMVVDDKWTDCWLQNGGVETIYSLDDNNQSTEWLKDWCSKLPFILDVGDEDDDDAFRLVHAEIPLDWSEEELQLKLLQAGVMGGDSGIENLIWSRTAIGLAEDNIANMKPASLDVPVWEGRFEKNIYVGHTPINRVIRLHNTTYIDTWRSKTLTMVNALTQEVHTVKVPYKNLKMG